MMTHADLDRTEQLWLYRVTNRSGSKVSYVYAADSIAALRAVPDSLTVKRITEAIVLPGSEA